jgi:hypothetical protein
MSGTGSLMIRNLRRPADYSKAVMTQDELLRIAVANDANISNARRANRNGEVPALTQQQSATPDELQEDEGQNESLAVNNLLSLGFRYDEASSIVSQINHDQRLILNNMFPAIKSEFEKKFVVSRTTPTAFIEYLDKFIQEFNVSKGLSGNTGLFNDKFDMLINNIDDLRAIIPTTRQMREIQRLLNALPIPAELRDMFKQLGDSLPDETFFRTLAGENDVKQQQYLARLQDILANIPTRNEFTSLSQDLTSNISLPEKIQELEDIISALDVNVVQELQDLREEIQNSKIGKPSAPIIILGALELPSVPEIGRLIVGRDADASGRPLGRKFIYKQDRVGNPPLKLSNTQYTDDLQSYPAFKAWIRRNLGRDSVQYNTLATYIEQAGKGGAGGSPAPPSSASSAVSTTSAVTDMTGATDTSSSTTAGLPTKGKGIKTHRLVGKGVDFKEEPIYRQFGKYVIHNNQLKDGDILNVKYRSLGRVPQFKPTNISEPTKEFILDLLDTGKANQRVYNTLPVNDRKLFEKIATGAGVFHHLGLKKTFTDDEHKDYERFQVLKGEYLAGNNSQALMKELRRLIVKFMNENKIHKTEGTNLLMELSI